MRVTTQKKAVDLAAKLITDWNKEHGIAIYVDSHLQLITAEVISLGTINANLMHPRELFRPAIVNRATGVILLHNHPTGNVKPSKPDMQVSRQLKKAGNIIGIRFQDSIVFNLHREFYSLLSHNKL